MVLVYDLATTEEEQYWIRYAHFLAVPYLVAVYFIYYRIKWVVDYQYSVLYFIKVAIFLYLSTRDVEVQRSCHSLDVI